jgi:RHS repeat-associated protein
VHSGSCRPRAADSLPRSVSDTSAAIAAAVPPSGPSVQYATSAAYDALNRPTGISWNPAPTAATPSGSGVTFGHAYNKANQRIGQTATDNSWLNYPAASQSTLSYTADALNRYTAVGAVTPAYDGNSNLTFDGTFTFGYDAENRLTSASGAGNTAAYTYDAQGRRKTKTVNGSTTVFVTDAGNREVLEYDGSSGAIQRWYAYGLGSNDVLNQMNVATSTRATLIPDIQGSVIASIDSSSGALSKIGYLPYGKSAAAPAPFGYTGQRIDPEPGGLYYYRARHYSPVWGRFMQPDPVGYGAGSNLYAYVGNDPVNLIDPFGFTADSPSYGQSLLQTTVNVVPGAYYSGLAQQQFQQGNYGNATIYGTLSIADAFLGIATLGLSTRVGTAVRAVETLAPAAERATEIANTLGRSQNYITIAVTDTAEGVRIISSSENALRPAALNALTGGEIAVTGTGHAEVTGINAARDLGLTPIGTAASRPICPTCAQFLQNQGVSPLGP